MFDKDAEPDANSRKICPYIFIPGVMLGMAHFVKFGVMVDIEKYPLDPKENTYAPYTLGTIFW